MSSIALTPDQQTLFELTERASYNVGVKTYLIGGIVRNIFLRKEIQDRDIDFIVDGSAEALATRLSEVLGGELKSFPKFLTAKIVSPSKIGSIDEVDFASTRGERYATPGALPEVFPVGIEHDLARRDFSINAVALPLSDFNNWISKQRSDLEQLKQSCLDPYQGLKALEQAEIRILHELSFRDDPTRIFRAIRYRVRLDGRIVTNTIDLLREALSAGHLRSVEGYRIVNELKKLCQEKNWIAAWEDLLELDVLSELGLISAELFEQFRSRLAVIATQVPRSFEANQIFVLMLVLLTSLDESIQPQLKALGISSSVRKSVIETVQSVKDFRNDKSLKSTLSSTALLILASEK